MNNKLQYVILEDEDDIRQWLIKKICQYPELEIIGEATTVDDGYHLIASTKPDVAFMDIHLIGGDAFMLLSRLQANGVPIPYIVMATGYPDYAMTALNDYRQYIVQYIVKPFIENWQINFRKAIDAIIAAKMKESKKGEAIAPPKTEAPDQYVFVPYSGGLLRLNFSDIIYLEAAGGGDSIVVTDETNYTLSISLTRFLKLLPSFFERVSKSNIVNINRIIAINRSERTVEINCKKKNTSVGISDRFYQSVIKKIPRIKV